MVGAGRLLAGVLLRQWLNALPLAIYIDGCGSVRAMQNDQVAILFTTIAPPPSDLVMRLAMFRSCGISATDGMAGTVLNTLTFYVVRFGTPVLGLLLMAALDLFDPTEVVPALLSATVSVALLIVLWRGFSDARLAAAIGLRAGRAARRVRRTIDPDRWRDAVLAFRDTASGRVRSGFPRSLGSLIAMVLVDAGLILLAIRSVGITPEQLAAPPLLMAFLVAYPLTLFFFSGLGILDAAVIATLLHQVGVDPALEPDLVAAFLVWRAATLITPLLLGVVSLAAWKIQVLRH